MGSKIEKLDRASKIANAHTTHTHTLDVGVPRRFCDISTTGSKNSKIRTMTRIVKIFARHARTEGFHDIRGGFGDFRVAVAKIVKTHPDAAQGNIVYAKGRKSAWEPLAPVKLVHLVPSVVWALGLGKTPTCRKPPPTPAPPTTAKRPQKVAGNPWHL